MAHTVPKTPNYNPRRINRYVPGMQYAADVQPSGMYRTSLGSPAAASATAILSAQSIATAGSTTTLTIDTMDATFGRNVQVVASGAATSTVTVKGRDYLGQPMLETITLNGATAVHGVKAFKWLDSVSWTATSATTINLGTGFMLGLPYVTSAVINSQEETTATGAVLNKAVAIADQSTAVAAPGTAITALKCVVADFSTPSATTGDTRGTFRGSTTYDGTFEIYVVAYTFAEPSSGNATVGLATIQNRITGGLLGNAHYFA